MGMSLVAAKALPACSLLAAILGCLLSVALVPKYISRERALAVCAALGVILSVAAVIAPGKLSVAFVALLGLSASPVWSHAFSLTAKAGKGSRASAAILAVGALGGALLPLAYGYLADAVGTRHAYWLLAPCYAAILLYAVAKANLSPAKHIQAKE
jgi:fucose permease